MSYPSVKAFLLACGGVSALLAATADANAGGFALREQSAYGQGSSYAGVAAGGSLSSMFWNPATMTQVPGIQTELVASAILPYATNTPGMGSVLASPPFSLGGTDNSIINVLLPAGYASWQLNRNMWLGISLNSPFGLSVRFPDLWAGRDYAAGDSNLKTYNVTPSFAYRFNDMISVGFGVQIQYAQTSLTQGVSVPGLCFCDATLSGNGWGYGLTAGVTVTPTPTTTVGLGYRSAINQKINGSGTLTGALAPLSAGAVSTTLDLPDVISLGLKQRVSPQLTLLGTVEWSNWSRIATSAVTLSSGAPATILGHPVTLPFQYQDGWFFSVGAEYQWTDRLAVRGGVGYEISPITDQVRTPLLPDNDRIWLSVGASYHISKDLIFDLAYSHAFVKSTPINISQTSGNPWFDGVPYVGDVSSHFDILSLAIKYRWDEPALAPKSKLITK